MSYISAITKGNDVLVWERDKTGRREVQYRAPWYFYVPKEDGKYESIYGDKLTKLIFSTRDEYRQAKQDCNDRGIRMFESDITPEMRILSTEYKGATAPKLNVTFYDIEVDYDPNIGFAGVKNPYAPINSVSLYHRWKEQYVLITVPPSNDWTDPSQLSFEGMPALPPNTEIIFCKNERELLGHFLMQIEDSDMLSGWNSNLFDMPYIGKRIELTLGKHYLKLLCFPGCDNPRWAEVIFGGVEITDENREKNEDLISYTLELNGRLHGDYLMLYKKYEPGERSSYKLEAISDIVLVDDEGNPILPKLNYEGSLHSLYRNNFPFFLRYNLRDTEILNGFEDKLGYVELSNQTYHMSSALFQHAKGSIRLAEFAVIDYCHHTLNKIVPDFKKSEIDRQIEGAYVLVPKVGMHEMLGSIDITSLYPSSIRSINISPETLRGQFLETTHAAEEIAQDSFTQLTFTYEDTQKTVMKTASEWREEFKERKWAVSGYGTAFDQTKPGIIPTILTEWFTMRKKYQALKKEAAAKGDADHAAYYDRLQYVFKIKLNSVYGAMSNLYFRFYDLRMGESTTGTGRMILRHQCAKANEILTGEYDATGDAVIYGDTDSTYFKTYADNPKMAVKIADAVAAKINESYSEFLQNTFLCLPEYAQNVKAAREIVSDRGIFIQKKRYMLHVIDQDGKSVDKLKVMGVDTKKTTIPKPVADKLNSFIERLLKGDEWDVIAKDIVKFKLELLKTDDIMSIGLPKGVKRVEQYTREYEHDRTTRLPGHVAAAVFYNKCRELYNDKESLPITSGMKIKVFYMTESIGRFVSVALPTDIEVIPQWFLDNFTIDRDKHIDRLVNNPLNNILKAIGKETPTAHSLFVDELFSF